MKMFDIANNLSRRSVISLSFILVAITGWLDYLTGMSFSLSIFYLISVTFAAWFGGRWAGIMVSFASAAAWLIAAEMASKKEEFSQAIIFWNVLMEFGFFLAFAGIVWTLRRALEHEKHLARTDVLTGVSNRRRFYDLTAGEIERLKRYGHVFSVAYMDIDNFKAVNDRFGHSAGDALLRLTAEITKSNIRAIDTVARLGGDEFAMLMPETGERDAQAAVRKIQLSLEQAVRRNQWPVSLSIGMITYLTPPESVDAMIERADALMYSVKTGGKGRIRHEVVGSEWEKAVG